MATNNTSSTMRSERSDSTSSSSSAGSGGSSPSFSRRTSGGLFESLTAQKRKDDPASIARRQSMSDQRPKPGFIGQMWNNWVYGTTSKK